MPNLNTLETFRTKDELVNYFKEMGRSITEEQIEALKKNYEQVEKSNNTLSLKQLDAVAGGAEFLLLVKIDPKADQGANFSHAGYVAAPIITEKGLPIDEPFGLSEVRVIGGGVNYHVRTVMGDVGLYTCSTKCGKGLNGVYFEDDHGKPQPFCTHELLSGGSTYLSTQFRTFENNPSGDSGKLDRLFNLLVPFAKCVIDAEKCHAEIRYHDNSGGQPQDELAFKKLSDFIKKLGKIAIFNSEGDEVRYGCSLGTI